VELFSIKNIWVQNAVMAGALALVLALLVRGIAKRNARHIIVFAIWAVVVVLFFNSSFFGFSTLAVGPEGIAVNYGFLSLKNTVLPLDSPWRIETRMGGIRKNERLYWIEIAQNRSMPVRGDRGRLLLENIGAAIDRMKNKAGGL
jgi:hypothetical protein